tara:strand:- start:14392 stop:14934 length:543 start_codon:yes stop_codon:yes gene_type:complete
MSLVYQYTGPNLRGAKKEMRKAIDAALKNHRRRFMPRHFTPRAFTLYPAEYQQNSTRKDTAHRAAAIRARFDATPRSEWEQLRLDIQAKFDQNRANPNRLLPLVDTGIMRQMVLLQHATFQGSLNARKMLLTVPWYIVSPEGVANKRAALEVIRRDEGTVFAKVADKRIQKYANTKTRKR